MTSFVNERRFLGIKNNFRSKLNKQLGLFKFDLKKSLSNIL